MGIKKVSTSTAPQVVPISQGDSGQKISQVDQSVQNAALKIFRAKPSPGIHYSRQEKFLHGAIFVAKWLFFPLTIPISLIFKKIARSEALADGHSHIRNDQLLRELRTLGGQSVHFLTEDGNKLEGMRFQSSAPNRSGKTILVCSGNMDSNEYYNVPIVKALLAMGHDVMTFNYRGFGESQGNPSESGLYKDGEAAYQYLLNQGVAQKIWWSTDIP